MEDAELGLSKEKINGFKEWVKSQNKRPRVWDARRWFREPGHSHDEQDASLDQALDLLIDEAIEDAVKEMNDRNKVIYISFSYLMSPPWSFRTLCTSFGLTRCVLTVTIGIVTSQNSWLRSSFALYAAPWPEIPGLNWC